MGIRRRRRTRAQLAHEILLFADGFCIRHGKLPTNAQVREDVGGNSVVIAGELRAYAPNMPPFCAEPDPLKRAYAAYDHGEKHVWDFVNAYLLLKRGHGEGEPAALLLGIRRFLNMQVMAVDALVVSAGEDSRALLRSAYELAKDCWTTYVQMRESVPAIGEGMPGRLTKILGYVERFLEESQDDSVEARARNAVKELLNAAVDAHREGKILHMHLPDMGWKEVGGMRPYLLFRPCRPGDWWNTPELTPDQMIQNAREERAFPPPARHIAPDIVGMPIRVDQAAEIACVNSKALTQRIRAAMEKGEECPFQVPTNQQGKGETWHIANAWTSWYGFHAWMKSWKSKKAPRAAGGKSSE